MTFQAVKKIFKEAAERGCWTVAHFSAGGTVHVHFDENAKLIACDMNAQVIQVEDYSSIYISAESIEYIEVYPSTQTNKQ